MNIREELLREHSKANSIRISRWIGNDKSRFKELMTLFLANEYRVTQRSAWVLQFCTQAHPELTDTYLEPLIMNLKNKPHVAVTRNTLRLLQEIDIPDNLLGHTSQICFDLVYEPDSPIAVKVFAMTVLGNICEKEPELSNELQLIIEQEMENGSPGIRSRGKKLLKKLGKIRQEQNKNH